MIKKEVLLFDITKFSLDYLLQSKYLNKDNLSNLSKYKNEEVKKEKVLSLIVKKKYVGNFYLNHFGKPLCDNFFFSISHSNDFLVFIKDDNPIGIDIEKIKNVNEDLINYISSDVEKTYIKSDKNFFEIWTSKESLIKLVGTTLNNRINEISSLPLNDFKYFDKKKYYSKTISYKDYIITVSSFTDSPFKLEIKEITDL